MTTETIDAHPSVATRWWTREDWLAVWLGWIVLLLIVVGASPPLPALKWGGGAALSGLLLPRVLLPWAVVGIGVWLLSTAGIALLRGNVLRYSLGFAVVFALAWASLVLAGFAGSTAWGVEYVIFALALGLLVSHVAGVPAWLREAVRTEYFIKTGLVVMGA
jgi:hypothetical protein